MLIDCGIGPRTCAKRMEGTGVTLGDVRAICLTHLDSDHFKVGWMKTIVARGIRVFCDQHRVEEVMTAVERTTWISGACLETMDDASGNEMGGPRKAMIAAFEKLICPFNGKSFSPLDGVEIHSIPLAHDRMGSSGFVIGGFGARVGFATDLGRVPKRLIERFCELDILALESNYDSEMQLSSSRPWYLKQRIMNGAGHLSNAQALEAIRMILDRCEATGSAMPAHVVLLHRSRECNCPKLLRMMFHEDARIAKRLTLAEQLERTEWLRPVRVRPSVGEQLALQWG
ncbi:MAG TPA: MBL fold metallo-hydrolase [Tepidisphaeraceae bacterium]|nr:MBL fold metallo-hydrolase [Tepidisphaeraceae bacterium]